MSRQRKLEIQVLVWGLIISFIVLGTIKIICTPIVNQFKQEYREWKQIAERW